MVAVLTELSPGTRRLLDDIDRIWRALDQDSVPERALLSHVGKDPRRAAVDLLRETGLTRSSTVTATCALLGIASGACSGWERRSPYLCAIWRSDVPCVVLNLRARSLLASDRMVAEMLGSLLATAPPSSCPDRTPRKDVTRFRSDFTRQYLISIKTDL